MKITTRATLLTAESKPYDIDGNKGVSHRARFLIDGEIYKVNATQDEISYLNEIKAQDNVLGDLTLSFSSPKENMKVQFVSFE